jgi:hypothetical protein
VAKVIPTGTGCLVRCQSRKKRLEAATFRQERNAAKPEKRAGNRVRTDDLLITNQLLYQLSYAGITRAL